MVCSQLEAQLAQQLAAANGARDEAISEENRPENRFDTRSLEAAYLAEGQARLVSELRESLVAWRALPVFPLGAGSPVSLGALVELAESGQDPRWYLVGPTSGGLELTDGQRSIMVVTPSSPLGRSLIGRRSGDTVALPARGGSRSAELRSVS